MQPEPILDLAHLGHMELLTPKPDESLKFFVDVMGMTVSGQKGESVYLRGWDDYERYSLKLTASKTSGMEHMALRARSQQALERRVAALKGSGFDIGWIDGDMGQGPTFRCRDPDGHIVELYYETEWYQAPPELKPALKNQAQRFPARGVNVRRLDHLNCLAVDIKANREFFENYLGCRLTEQIVLNDGREAAMWLTMSNKSYDFAYSLDHSGTAGRFHHVTYALDSREEILRAADIFLENGIHIETRPAQARDPADLLPLCLRARRQPRRSRQCRRAPHPRARLEADRVDGRRTQEGAGVGPQDDRVVSHARHAAGAAQEVALSSRRLSHAQSSPSHRSMLACRVRTACAGR
ncbi:catechol 2,3-dioxygenase [Bradyrhizobium sp. GM22.5]